MKKVFLSIVALAALMALPMSVSADQATSVTKGSSAKVKVIKALTVESNASTTGVLDFGTLVLGDVASGTNTATINPVAGAQTAATAGNVSTLTTAVGQAALFNVKGTIDAPFTVSINGGENLEIESGLNVTFNHSAITSLDGDGDIDYYVGGVLAITNGVVMSNTQKSKNFNVVFNYE